MRITINGLTAKYELSKQLLYDKLSVEFPDRSITGLFGPNGVGKSTLVRLLGHLDDGIRSNSLEAIFRSNQAAYVSYVPQKYAQSLLPWMSVDDNISLPLKVLPDMDANEIDTRCCALKEAFKVQYSAPHPNGLSGGQQQILVLLRAIIRQPDLLLLDEPFSALDIYTGAQFRDDYFRYLSENGITTIFVTHDLRECIRFSDRIVFLQKDSSTAAFVQHIEDFPSNHKMAVRDENYLSATAERLLKSPESMEKVYAC